MGVFTYFISYFIYMDYFNLFLRGTRTWIKMILPSVSLHDEDDPQRLDPSYTIILLIIPFYFILRRIHEFGILYSFGKSSTRLEQKREELKRKYKELKKVFGYEKVATVNEKNAIKKNTECIKLLQAKLIIENRMRGCMEENYFLDQRKLTVRFNWSMKHWKWSNMNSNAEFMNILSHENVPILSFGNKTDYFFLFLLNKYPL